MTEEPIYEYTRGVGWVPCVELPYLLGKCRNGLTYRIEMRIPKPGEFFCWAYTEDGWNVNRWKNWLADITFHVGDADQATPITITDLTERSNHDTRPISVCTFVRLSDD